MMSNFRHGFALLCVLTLNQIVLPELSAADPNFDDDNDWKYSGSMWLLMNQFYLDGAKNQFVTATVSGNVLNLRLKQLSLATRISYLKETSWNPEKLLRGKNGIAALMFYDVSVLSDARR